MKDKDSDFLRRQAERCIALSRATIDLTVAGRLRAMAADFQAKAAESDSGEADAYDCRRSKGGDTHGGRARRS